MEDEDHLFALDLLWDAQQVGNHLARLPRIDVFFARASGLDPILMHDPFDAVFPRCQHHCQFAMPHRVIVLMELLNAHRQRFVHLGALGLHIEVTLEQCPGYGPPGFC